MIFKNFADQDWIGFKFCGSGLDSDCKISQSAHLYCSQRWPGCYFLQSRSSPDFVNVGLNLDLKK